MLSTIRSLKDADIFVNDRIRSDGTFVCYLGEEITIIDGKYNAIWQVVGVDTELNKGDIPLTQHHISLVPKNFLCMDKMHSIDDNCNGYANSDTMYAKTIPGIVSALESVLGDHLLTRRVKLTNATSSGTSPRGYMASANGYYSVKANLMCQMQVFGNVDGAFGNQYDAGDDIEQLPGFKSGKVDIANGVWWWLRDVYGHDHKYGNHYYFHRVYDDGSLDHYIVNGSLCVRPLITIG